MHWQAWIIDPCFHKTEFTQQQKKKHSATQWTTLFVAQVFLLRFFSIPVDFVFSGFAFLGLFQVLNDDGCPVMLINVDTCQNMKREINIY